MSISGKTAFERRVCAAAAIMAFAVAVPARAQAPVARSVIPATTPAASAPAVVPAVMTPSRPPANAQPVRPAALQPATVPTAPAAAACNAPPQFARLDHPLLHTARRLASGEPLTIVAIGSSSTAGAGASSPAASYPSRLAIELRKLFPGHDITVLNRGVNGEETNDMMARFATGVIAEHPQLVLWQVGTNSVLRDRPLLSHLAELRQGIDELKQTGADIVLVDLQYAPTVLAKSETAGMVDQIALVAREKNVDLFRRFAVMRDWYENRHYAFDTFVSPDGLHMNDWGYACWAKLFAAAIAAAASPPIASTAPEPMHH